MHQVPDKSPTFCTKNSTESQFNKETIEPPIKHLFTNKSWKPVVPQPDISLPDGPPPFCGRGQCVKCSSLRMHLTYTPALKVIPLSVLCMLINLKSKKSLKIRALFDNYGVLLFKEDQEPTSSIWVKKRLMSASPALVIIVHCLRMN